MRESIPGRHISRFIALVLVITGTLLPLVVAQAQTLSTLHAFAGTPDGAAPTSGLIYNDGFFYGTTNAGGGYGVGMIYKMNATTGAVTLLHSFSRLSDGMFPYASLILVNGYLYGTTSSGGSKNFGTVFKVDPTTGAETIVHNFGIGTDGTVPYGPLTYVDGSLYGATTAGGTGTGYSNGPSGAGVVYKINLTTNRESVLYNFSGGADGLAPYYGALLYVNGSLYGTTCGGGASQLGTLFALDLATRQETVLYSFQQQPDGAFPCTGLTYSRGTFYGNTGSGGTSGFGTIFKFNLPSGKEDVLYSFTGGADGASPGATALTFNKGNLYGTTILGGSNYEPDGDGTIFSFNVSTGTFTTLYTFTGGDDTSDAFGTLLLLDGTLYGTTKGGGTYGQGTIFQLMP